MSTYHRVIHRKKEGTLVASSDHLFFQHSQDSVEKWVLDSLDKVSANAMGKPLLRINMVDSQKKPLFFLFDNRDSMEAAKLDIKARVIQARALHGESGSTNMDMDVTWNEHDVPKSSEFMVPSTLKTTWRSKEAKVAPLPDSTLGSVPNTQDSKLRPRTSINMATVHCENENKSGTSQEFLADKTESTSACSDANGCTVACSDANGGTVASTGGGMDLPQNREELMAFVMSAIEQNDRIKSEKAHHVLEVEDVEQEIAVQPMAMEKSPFGDLDPAKQDEDEKMKLIERNPPRNDDDIWHAPFPESTFTLIYMCSATSQGFWYATFIYALQVTTITLTMVDIIDADVKENPFRIPPMVGLTVTIAQAIALFMALAYQSDLIEAVIKIQDGFYPEVLERHPGATFGTWLFSCLAQLGSGLLLLVASFILTMQMESVIEGMLNLTALTFMAEIDDIGFAMAKMGFIRSQLQKEAESVVDFMVPKRKSRNLARRMCYLLALVGLFVGYSILKNRQLNGYYLQTYIYVQFGDAYNKKIPYFSGLMTSGNVRTQGYREYRDVGTDNILLGYCSSEKAWAFSDKGDPCLFFAKSVETSTYDVTSIPDSEWHILDSIGRLQPFDTFSLVGRDCDGNVCQGKCGDDGLCHCGPNRFGMDCEFAQVCKELSIDRRFSAFPAATKAKMEEFIWGEMDDDWYLNQTFLDNETMPPYSWVDTYQYAIADEFAVLKNSSSNKTVQVYNMPVYYSNKTYPANIIFFAGRRWVLTSELGLFNLTEARLEDPSRTSFPEKTVAVLEADFHAYYKANYTTFFLSDPVDFETPDFLPTPAGLRWHTVGVVNETARHYAPDSALDTVLNCKTCSADQGGFCGMGGHCNQETGECECAWGYTGDKCELQEACYEMMGKPCYGHGLCDQNSGLCRCNLPFFGNLCERSYKCYEEYGTCRNGGQCNMTTGWCDCPDDPAIEGAICDLRQDCSIYGCQNGGLCGPEGKCVCRPPFHGFLCHLVNTTQEELLCTTNADCTDGSCNVTSGICTCEDPTRIGTLCEHQYNCSLTELFVCTNSGTCNQDSGLCDCPKGYSGPDCSEIAPCLEDSDCAGEWSSCFEGTCYCAWPLSGPFCERGESCKESGCSDRGNCNIKGYCDCASPFGGSNCDYVQDRGDEDDEYSWSYFDMFASEIEVCGFPPFNMSAPEYSVFEGTYRYTPTQAPVGVTNTAPVDDPSNSSAPYDEMFPPFTDGYCTNEFLTYLEDMKDNSFNRQLKGHDQSWRGAP